jgi:CheY-like chemotaxis protein
MTALLVVLMFVGFVLLDLIVRSATRRLHDARLRHEREAVLNTAVRLDFTHEARSLKRAEVPAPKARILAVDDEPVVLDSLRKILVLEGYSVDTVETGPEALGLVQRRDYDFVFTDLKMPGMDGVEVVKAVKHLRPDVDVAVITGYGTIETAVETMQQGAVAYVQKPFTAEELASFVRELSIKREARLEALRRPTVRVMAPSAAETAPRDTYCVPGGAFLSGAHVWVRIEPSGLVKIGIDDFARKALGTIERITPPGMGATVVRGEPLFTLGAGGQAVRFPAPLGGRIERINDRLAAEPGLLAASPYDRGWICLLEPSSLAEEIAGLRIGKPVVEWYVEEIQRLREKLHAGAEGKGMDWGAIEEEFFFPPRAVRV